MLVSMMGRFYGFIVFMVMLVVGGFVSDLML